ncbi:DUF5658 family protein [Halopenitus persicus]|uniref:DUF5658 family protein n=1 Tax=Halopenitus persicus TaxID=1048396 RepID=UPI000BBB2002|nr:DUF5658 family protein [Halopenitus persicus]
MVDTATDVELDVRQWWVLFGIALFLLVPLDLLTTLIAVATYGLSVEANPVMRWHLQRGLLVTTVVNLVVVGVSVAMFHLAIERIRDVPPGERRVIDVGVTVWLTVLIGGGVVLVFNNLLVIV